MVVYVNTNESRPSHHVDVKKLDDEPEMSYDPVMVAALYARSDIGDMMRVQFGLRLVDIGECLTAPHARLESIGDWCPDDEILIERKKTASKQRKKRR